MFNADLELIADALETAAGATTTSADSELGRWKRIVAAAEALAGAATTSNDNIAGYMKRTAVALELIAGGDGTAENDATGGYLKRIVDALEIQAGAVGTSSIENRFVIAAQNATFAFDPASLFALGEQGGWYDPSDLSTLWQDTAGTVPVTADGQSVARINDKSGRGNHRTQATAGARPLYKTSGGLHWLQFDGADDTLTAAGAYPLSPTLQMWLAMRYTAGASAAFIPLAQHFVGGTDYFRIAVRNNAALAQASTRGGGVVPTLRGIEATTNAAITAATNHVLAAKFIPGTTSLRVDNAAAVTGANTWLDADTVANARPSDGEAGLVGAWRDYGSIFLARLATADEELGVREFLGGKSGVSIT